MHEKAEELINTLKLQPHPEGGFFRETYRSQININQNALPQTFSAERSICTAIFFLLSAGQVSTFHRLKADELWHHYQGVSFYIHVINTAGVYKKILLGQDFAKGESPQVVVPAKSWFGATLNATNGYGLVGCTVSPGFDFSDFEPGDRTDLLQNFPQYKDIILQLT
ncbi:cupin domain-containing protein [Candidatus Riflebacteria bacterium]